jgi:hypothetical protein
MRAPSSADSCPAERSPFASRTVTRHLLRGAAGIALVVVAFAAASTSPVLAIAAGTFAVVAFRGCPMCWSVGLVETVANRVRRR